MSGPIPADHYTADRLLLKQAQEVGMIEDSELARIQALCEGASEVRETWLDDEIAMFEERRDEYRCLYSPRTWIAQRRGVKIGAALEFSSLAQLADGRTLIRQVDQDPVSFPLITVASDEMRDAVRALLAEVGRLRGALEQIASARVTSIRDPHLVKNIARQALSSDPAKEQPPASGDGAPTPSQQEWQLVPVEPTPEMLEAAEVALNRWREGLTGDERLLRHVVKDGRGYTEATVTEKHAIRWRAMLQAAPS